MSGKLDSALFSHSSSSLLRSSVALVQSRPENGQNARRRADLASRREALCAKDEMPEAAENVATRGNALMRSRLPCRCAAWVRSVAGFSPALHNSSLITGTCGKPQLLTNRVFEQNASEKKLTLGIGGVATLYQGGADWNLNPDAYLSSTPEDPGERKQN